MIYIHELYGQYYQVALALILFTIVFFSYVVASLATIYCASIRGIYTVHGGYVYLIGITTS